jgi:hypothetical protein
MARLGLAERDDLAAWGKAEGALADLPRLVRRLILETAPGLVSLGFAAGVGVFGSDWDGTVRASAPTVKVPGGLSLWELSTRADVNRKANSDYAKRTAEGTPDGTPMSDAAYVAVSTRTWQGRDEWALAKGQEGHWREVRAYGVDDLEAWLEDAPVTWAWISELMGLQSHGLETAQRWWGDWAAETEPALPVAAILAGRESVVEKLRLALAGPGQLITIAGASYDDVLSFLCAVAIAETEQDGGALLARAAFIDRVEAWRRWRDRRRPLLLAPINDEVAAAMAAGSEHHLIVPVVGGSADYELPPINAQAAGEALKEAGLDKERAEAVGQLLRLSLIAGRRRIAVKPELHRPEWARAPVARLVRRAVLIGRFSENQPADLEVAAELLGAEYAAVADELGALVAAEDPLLARLGASLAVVSPVDAWLLVGERLLSEDVDVFRRAAIKVLTEIDPRQELAPEDRWQAGVLGKVRAHSHDLRHGIATTLALMGAYGDAVIPGARLTPAELARWIVREVLDAANGDRSGRLWASLDDVITLLAEAAPEEFLAAVGAGLAADEPLLAKLFTDPQSSNALYAAPSHSGLLWALEVVSWSPDHFGAVVELVARWASVDPGGRYSNRPEATLTAFFRGWYPQSSVNAGRRLDVIDALRRRQPAVAWPLLLSLLPDMHGFATDISAPRYRDWKQPDRPKTHGDMWSFYDAVFARALEDAGTDPDRLVPLVDDLPTLPPPGRAALFARLEEMVDGLEPEARERLWVTMRTEASNSRRYAEADWALPEEDLTELERLVARYEPRAATTRTRWLFEDYVPSIPGVDMTEGEESWGPLVAAARAEAAAEIVRGSHWEAVLAFARSLQFPWFLGIALVDAGLHEHESELLALLDDEDAVDVAFAESYFGERFRHDGWAWLETVLAHGLSPRQQARLLLATRDWPAGWERLPNADVSGLFWSEFRVNGLGGGFPHVDTVVAALYGVGRFGAGLDLLNLYLRNDAGGEWAELVATGLEQLLEHGAEGEVRQLSQYGFRNLFAYLERVSVDQERLARLEWSYLPAFAHEPAPQALSRALAESPAFFVDVVSRVFRPGDEDENGEGAAEETEEKAEEPDEQTLAIARNAYSLLSEWRLLPGRRDDGSVDADELRVWVGDARARLREARRLRVGDIYIGKVLTASPPDTDGAWPCEAVRDVLEEVQSPQIESGMRTEIFNSLGATSRGLLDGGDQERDKSAIYSDQAQRFVDRWPRTAAVLRAAAESFQRMARDHDDDAERWRTGFGH